jgi:hypothetical protein
MMGEKPTRRCCARQAFIGENSVFRQGVEPTFVT